MYSAPGVGLAAPQVGVSKRLFVMDCSGGKDPAQRVALINPVILRVEGEQNGDEGCLSFPDIFLPVKRSLRAVVQAQDVDGNEFEVDGLELTARCMLHELTTATASSSGSYDPAQTRTGQGKIKKRLKQAGL